jgi:DNA-binding SARP family transcriptional activator/tetratricopeptide (TPR) repeat protein
MLRLRLFGALTGEVDGRPVAMPPSERARALIGWLALHPGTHSRAGLAARIWPDVPDAGARASLRTALWTIRQSWGPVADLIVTTRTEIGFPPGTVWVDALDGEVDAAPGVAGDWADGDLLPGVADDWADEERDRWRARRIRALSDLADRADRDGRDADGVRISRQLCRLEPLDEALHRALVDRLIRVGDKAGAVVAARDFAELLHAELGVRPSPATRASHARLRAAAPEPPRPHLFGRADHLRRLTTCWRAAAAGEGQVVVLTGEAGIGKTSLLGELTHRVALAGGRVAVGAGMDVVGETPFALWLELARGLIATLAPPPAAAGWPVELNRLAPQLGAKLGHPELPPTVSAPELERLRVFEAVLRLVEWSCADRPAVLALDDAHRADQAGLRLTAHVGRRVARLPLLLVLTRRDRPARPELDAVLADLAGRAVPITEITVGPIADTDVAALAADLLPAGDAAIRQVISVAEGNPLLAVESARVIASGGSGPPPNLRMAVRATAGLLTPAARTLVHLLAAAGRPLSSRELDGLGLSELDLAEQTAGADGLLVRRGGRLGFRHDLLREAVYADLPDPAPLHDRIVAALDPGDHAEIAHHLSRAGREEQAAREWAAAAAYARSVGALTEAAALLIRAVEAAPGDGGLWLELEEIWAWLGRRPDMESAWQRALELLSGPDVPRAWCRRGLQLRTVVCHPESALRAYREAEQAPDADRATRVATLVGLAWGEAVAGDPARCDALLAAAEALLPADPSAADAAAVAGVRADIAEIRMQGLIRQGRFADAVQIARSAGPAAERDRLADRAYAVWVNAACALTCTGDYGGALALADRAVATTEAVPMLLAGCLAARAHLLARLGRHAEAAEASRRQRACAQRLDSPELAATAAHDAGLVALAAGDHAAAAELLAEALRDGAGVARAAAGGAGFSRPTAGLRRAEALALLGDADAAAAQLRAAMLEPTGRADQPWALVPRVAWVQGLIARARGDLPLARKRFAEAASGWRSMLASVDTATAEGYTATLVDLGRPPVVGLVEPGRELARVEQAMTMMG